jgi:hypothetical protein
MSLFNELASMCAGSFLFAVFIIALAVNLSKVARRWLSEMDSLLP